MATITIANGETTSGAIQTHWNKGFSLGVLQIPAAFTGTSMTFEGSLDGGTTFAPIYAESSHYAVQVGADRMVSLKLTVFAGFTHVKLVSNASETGDRTIAYGLIQAQGG